MSFLKDAIEYESGNSCSRNEIHNLAVCGKNEHGNLTYLWTASIYYKFCVVSVGNILELVKPDSVVPLSNDSGSSGTKRQRGDVTPVI